MKRLAAIALTILLIASPALAQSPATVLSIGDGDTITVNQNGQKVKVCEVLHITSDEGVHK